MKSLKSTFAMFMAVGLALAAVAAHASEPLQPETFGRVSFVTGGVGIEEEAAMKAMAHDYDFFATFVGASRAYLTNLDVKIVGPTGKVVLETRTLGPMLLAKLPDGHYTMTARLAGWKTAHHAFDVVRGKLSRAYVRLSPARSP